MSLFDYFQCEALLVRRDEAVLGDLRQRQQQRPLPLRTLVEFLQDATVYHLTKTQQRCLDLIHSTPLHEEAGMREWWRSLPPSMTWTLTTLWVKARLRGQEGG